MKPNSGNDIQAGQMGGDVAGITGTATATSATSLTGTGTPFVASAYIGHMVVAGSVYGVITANTTSVLTVGEWLTANAPGTVASTPGSTSTFVVLPGNAPAWYHALTADATSPASGDTTLPSEITTAAGGLKRKPATYAHTTGANSYTLTTVFTANGSDSLPVTIAKGGTFQTLTGATGKPLFETLLTPATATLSASGDQLTVTQTVTT